jgi:hypothetical protein
MPQDVQSESTAHVPLHEALCRLPLHTRALWGKHPENVVTQARWDVAWTLILLLVIAHIGFGLPAVAHVSALTQEMLGTTPLAIHLVEVLFLATLSQIVLDPAGVLLFMALQFALAQAWHGQATFLGQCYTFLLFFVPISIAYSLLNSVLASLARSGSMPSMLLALAVGILTVSLNTSQMRRIHHLSAGKALIVVLGSSFVLVLIASLGAAILLGFLFTPFHFIPR